MLYVFLGVLVLVAIKLFKTPLKFALKLLLNTALGFAALIILNLLSTYTGISLGINLPNALVIGILGLPGFALLLIIQWLFGL